MPIAQQRFCEIANFFSKITFSSRKKFYLSGKFSGYEVRNLAKPQNVVRQFGATENLNKTTFKMKVFKIVAKIILVILILLSLFLWLIINASSHNIKIEDKLLPLVFVLIFIILFYLTKFIKTKNE